MDDMMAAKEAGLIRKVPKSYRTKVPCPSCPPGQGDKDCRYKCNRKAIMAGPKLLPHPPHVDAALRCPCGQLMIVVKTDAPIVASGRCLILDKPIDFWTCPKKCVEHHSEKGVRAKVIAAAVADGAKEKEAARLYTFLKRRAKAMCKFGLYESAIAK